MAEHRDEVLSFIIMLAVASVAAAAIGLQMLAGFAAGVIVTLGAAAIAGADFE